MADRCSICGKPGPLELLVISGAPMVCHSCAEKYNWLKMGTITVDQMITPQTPRSIVEELKMAEGRDMVQTLTCPKCGIELTGKENFCPNCGLLKPLQKKCPQCGMELTGKENFCPSCGYVMGDGKQPTLSENTKQVSTPTSPVSTRQESSQIYVTPPNISKSQNNQTQKTSNSKSSGAYSLGMVVFLLFAWGALGIWKSVSMGVFWLVLCVLCFYARLAQRDKEGNPAPKWAQPLFWGLVILIFIISKPFSKEASKESVETSTPAVVEATDNQAESEQSIEEVASSPAEVPIEESIAEDIQSSLRADMGDDLGNAVYAILTEQIGFINLSYEGKVEGSYNYRMKADGIDLMVTAMPADEEEPEYIRIFQPSGDVFYEDGELLTSLADHKEEYDHIQNRGTYYIIAQSIIEDFLDTSSKTKFPSELTTNDVAFGWKNEYVVVQSYVDVKVSSGSYVRYKWTVEFIPQDLSNFTYQLVYFNFDGEEIGEYVSVE